MHGIKIKGPEFVYAYITLYYIIVAEHKSSSPVGHHLPSTFEKGNICVSNLTLKKDPLTLRPSSFALRYGCRDKGQ